MQTPTPLQTAYRLTWYRWVVLGSFFAVLFSSGATYGVFLPFSAFLRDTYGISHVFVVISGFVFNGVYPFTSLLIADKFIQRHGTHTAVQLFGTLIS